MKKHLKIGKKLLDLSTPKIMGIINTTPDSFYENSRTSTLDTILLQTEKHLNEGADFIDIGGYSTRPGAEDISIEDEIQRIAEPIRLIKSAFPNCIISCDTFRSKVAQIAIDNGADIINDISGGELDSEMYKIIAKNKTPYILMHSKGTPQNMQNQTDYKSIFTEMINYFSSKIELLYELGLTELIIDPGFGFAKTLEQNYEILNRLEDFYFLKHPILVGISRKSMIYKKLNNSPNEALNGTTILNTIAITKGANILRVHDVKEAKEIVQLLF
jgi:dihydropteroate synthase